MSYFLQEEIGDSETELDKDFFIVDVEDDAAESCCCESSFDHHNDKPDQTGINNKIISSSDKYYQDRAKYDDDDEADSSSSKVINNVGIADHSSTQIKLKSSVSESFVISISTHTGVVNMDEITDDRLFWDFCLAHGYP